MHFVVEVNIDNEGGDNMRAYGSNRISYALLDYSSKENSRNRLSKQSVRNLKRCLKKHESDCVKQQILQGNEYVA